MIRKTARIIAILLSISMFSASAFADGTAAAQGSVPLRVEWQQVPNANNYQVQISATESFNGPLLADSMTSNVYLDTKLPPGFYFFRHREFDAAGVAAAWSAASRAEAKPQAPSPIRVPWFSANGAPVTLNWNPVPGFDQYLVVIFRGQKELTRRLVRGTSLTLKGVVAGNYSWNISTFIPTVKRAPASGEPAPNLPPYLISQWAPAVKFMVSDEPASAKKIKLNAPGSRVPLSPNPLVFSWVPLEETEKYVVRVFRKPAGKAAIETVLTKETQEPFLMTSGTRFPEGKYSWQVSAVDQAGANVLGMSEAEFDVIEPLSVEASRLSLYAGYHAGTLNYSATTPEYSTELQPMVAGPGLAGSYVLENGAGIELGYENRGFVFKGQRQNFNSYYLGGFFQRRFAKGAPFRYSLGLRINKAGYPEILTLGAVDYEVGNGDRMSLMPRAKLSFQANQTTELYLRGGILKNLSYSSTIRTPASSTQSMAYEAGAGVESALLYPWGFFIEGSIKKDAISHGEGAKKVDLNYSHSELFMGLFYAF